VQVGKASAASRIPQDDGKLEFKEGLQRPVGQRIAAASPAARSFLPTLSMD
jgi:hypothetical protein